MLHSLPPHTLLAGVFIFSHMDREEFLIRSFLALFGHTSWLHTNFAKCSVSPIGCSDEVGLKVALVMKCQLTPCPIKYLGIPLTLWKLSSAALEPLVDRIADRLPTWGEGASMMAKVGRLTLVRSVLATMPLH